MGDVDVRVFKNDAFGVGIPVPNGVRWRQFNASAHVATAVDDNA
jgi:hypothetical protein